MREYFRILKTPEFAVSGTKTKREGWFLGYHAIVEAAFTLKIAELAGLPDEERFLLLQAAMFSQLNKRRMYAAGMDKTVESMVVSRQEGEKELIGMLPGLDPRVLTISHGSGPDFYLRFIHGEISKGTPGNQLIDRLQGYNSFIHACVETTIDKSDPNKPAQLTDIISWQDRIRIAKERHIGEVAVETTRVGDKEMILT